MRKNDVAVLDIGSNKIVCLVGAPVTDGFVIKANGQSAYAGFSGGAWLEPAKLNQTVSSTIKLAEKQYGHKIDSLLIGAPGEFTAAVVRQSESRFRTKRRITQTDVDGLFADADAQKMQGYYPISRSVITYALDDGKLTVDPLGMVTESLACTVSYIFLAQSFSAALGSAAGYAGIPQHEFMSSCLAESLFLLPAEQRDKQAILIDIGYLTTSVMLVSGDGLMFLKSFSLGGGHISADLSGVLGIDFRAADELRQKLNLNLQFGPTDNYILLGGAEVKAAYSNEIAKARIMEIGEYIVECFNSYGGEIDISTPLYLTGGGLTYIKGGIDCLSAVLKKRVHQAKTIDPMTNKPEMASAYGLIDIALNSHKR